MRFRAEFDMERADCSWCPFFHRTSNDGAECNLAWARDEPTFMQGILTPSESRCTDVVVMFPMPIDCPLEVVTDAVPENRL
jgi:hypothetical protein